MQRQRITQNLLTHPLSLFPLQVSAQEFFDRGLEKQNSGDYQGAIADYDQAIKLNPDDADAYNNRGLARSALGNKQGAIADYDQAIKLNPDYAPAFYNRGLRHKEQRNKQRAIAGFQKAADLYQKQGNSEWHQKALEQLKKLQP